MSIVSNRSIISRLSILCAIWLLISSYLYYDAFHKGIVWLDKYFERKEFYNYFEGHFRVNKYDVIVWEVQFRDNGTRIVVEETFCRPDPRDPSGRSFDCDSKHRYYNKSPARGEFVAPENGHFTLEGQYEGEPEYDFHVKVTAYPFYRKILFSASLVCGLLGIIVFLKFGK